MYFRVSVKLFSFRVVESLDGHITFINGSKLDERHPVELLPLGRVVYVNHAFDLCLAHGFFEPRLCRIGDKALSGPPTSAVG